MKTTVRYGIASDEMMIGVSVCCCLKGFTEADVLIGWYEDGRF